MRSNTHNSFQIGGKMTRKSFGILMVAIMFFATACSPATSTETSSEVEVTIKLADTQTPTPTATVKPKVAPSVCSVKLNFFEPILNVPAGDTYPVHYITNNGTIWEAEIHCFSADDYEVINERPVLQLYDEQMESSSIKAKLYGVTIIGQKGYDFTYADGQLDIKTADGSYTFWVDDRGNIKFSGDNIVECTVNEEGIYQNSPLNQKEWNSINLNTVTYILCAGRNFIATWHYQPK